MLKLKFMYPEGGYIFYTDEEVLITLQIENDNQFDLNALITVGYNDYEGNLLPPESRRIVLKAGEISNVEFRPTKCERLGYYNAVITVSTDTQTLSKHTGFGVTTRFAPRSAEESLFGVSCGASNFVATQHLPFFAKIGYRMIRKSWPNAIRKIVDEAKKNDMKITAQFPGRNGIEVQPTRIELKDRFAKPEENCAYHLTKEFEDIVHMAEFGNEFSEERNVTLSAEWHKVSALARWKANPNGLYAPTGFAGVDINKIKSFYEQGVLDYYNFLGIHAYCFPYSPEYKQSYWSLERLRDLSKWMKENGVGDIPIALTEEGFPALAEQDGSECYSPSDMLTMDTQVDATIRAFIIFASMGVFNSQYFDGAFYFGFSMSEKDGPAPWPVAMAMCQLFRTVDRADYVGDYRKDDGVYYKVFRSIDDGKLFAAVWRPVYIAGSCFKSLNWTVDGSARESDGNVKEFFEYTLHHTTSETFIQDVMGNEIGVEDNKTLIGERPIYIRNISEDILSELEDMSLFSLKYLKREMPSPIVLGMNDESPIGRAAWITSRFELGETRNYKIRVHNYSDDDLTDTVIFEAPKGFTFQPDELNVSVPKGQMVEYTVPVTCVKASMPNIKIQLKSGKAAPSIQMISVACPLQIKPMTELFVGEQKINLSYVNHREEEQEFTFVFDEITMKVTPNQLSLRLAPGEKKEFSISIEKLNPIVDAVLTYTITSNGNSEEYQTVIPLATVEYKEKCDTQSIKDGQKAVISGYNLMATAGDENKFGALLGFAKPQLLVAYARMEIDDKYLYAHFDVRDKTVVCAKQTRRDNIDCDGIWLKLYHSMEDDKPYRHFTFVPTDPFGRPENCYLNEVSSGVYYAEEYTDYDFSKINLSATVDENGYTLTAKIDRTSIDMEQLPEQIIADIRVLDMNNDDWPRFFDTGKICYSVKNKR